MKGLAFDRRPTKLPLERGSYVLGLFPQAFVACFRPVPADYFARGRDSALIACPCGRRPLVAVGELVVCRDARAWVPTRAGCERTFFAGERLYVASPYA